MTKRYLVAQTVDLYQELSALGLEEVGEGIFMRLSQHPDSGEESLVVLEEEAGGDGYRVAILPVQAETDLRQNAQKGTASLVIDQYATSLYNFSMSPISMESALRTISKFIGGPPQQIETVTTPEERIYDLTMGEPSRRRLTPQEQEELNSLIKQHGLPGYLGSNQKTQKTAAWLLDNCKFFR